MSVRLHRIVRYAEILTIAVLAVAVLHTHRELEKARQVPVFLPSYEFEVLNDSEKGQGVRTRGTWIAERGPPEALQTTTIECLKQRMECVESSAMVVFVSGRGLLESSQASYAIDRWTEREVVTRAAKGRCTTRTLVLDLGEKRAVARTQGRQSNGNCDSTLEGKLELVSGVRVRAEAVRKSASF